jgi:hypothetical protein
MTSPAAVRAVIEQLIAKWQQEAAALKARAKALSDEGHDSWSNGYSGEAASRLKCADELEAAIGRELIRDFHAVSEVPEQAKQPMTNDEAMKLTGRVLTVGGLPFTVISASTYGDVRVFDPSRNVHLVFDSRETFENWAHGTPVPAAAPPPAEESR